MNFQRARVKLVIRTNIRVKVILSSAELVVSNVGTLRAQKDFSLLSFLSTLIAGLVKRSFVL